MSGRLSNFLITFVKQMKDRVYADKPTTLEHLKTNIGELMAEIPPNMCQKVVENDQTLQ